MTVPKEIHILFMFWLFLLAYSLRTARKPKSATSLGESQSAGAPGHSVMLLGPM